MTGPAAAPTTHRQDVADRSTSPDYVQSLARGLSVIRAFDAQRPRQTLSDVARATGLTRATARRFLHTLVELGYVDTDGSVFWLTPRVLDLGYSYLSAMPLADLAQPHLDKLSSRLGEMRRTLEHLVRIDPSQQDAHEMLDAALYNIEELGRRMGEYATAIEGDPARLEYMRRRLDRIHRLKLKYGATIGEVIAVGAHARAELDTLDRAEFERRQLEQAAEQARTHFVQLAAKLSASRARAARRLSKAVGTILPQLGMDGGSMEVVLDHLDEPSPHGAEDVEFRIALNKGFEPRALARIASGGELSRVMLALKTILAGLDDVPTLVFDEVDAGIGGKVAHAVGDKLRDVARDRQVFVITHLPQIASRAQHHLLVKKEERDARSSTTVGELRDDARVAELARLLGGDPESETSLAHAKELLAGKGA